MATYDASDALSCIAVPVLYVLSRSDRVVPPTLAPAVMAALQRAGVSRRYVEIDSDDGHCAAGSAADVWAEALHEFIDALADGGDERLRPA
jgi:homoserine O-acetyltransferase